MSVSCCSHAQEHKEDETNQGAQANSDFTKLLDHALCCAVWSSCNNAVVNPSDIEDPTHSLPDVEREKGQLKWKLR
jgi:hypothetical protein